MKKVSIVACLLCIVFGIGIFMARPASADAGFVINEGILQKYTGNAEKVVIPGNVTIIGSAAFDENDTVTEVEMPANLREIQSSAFQGCDNLKKVTMNNKVTKMGQMCFRNCVKLESIVIPESVNFIGSAAFQYCYSLKSIKIPGKVMTIEYGAFSGCSNLTEITVSDSNEKFKSEDGVLFDAYEGMLLAYPAGKKDASYTIPDWVYSVEKQAFWEVKNLTEIKLPDSVRFLNEKSFSHCKMISEIHIPESVTKIDTKAFEECRALRGVYVMNDRVSFGEDVFKGSPGVELYGGIGSAAEEYAGRMRIAFHVVDPDPDTETKTVETSAEEESHAAVESKKEQEEDDEKTESSGRDLTRWILFIGIVLAAALVLLFGILMVRRIGKEGENSSPEMPGWGPRPQEEPPEPGPYEPQGEDWETEVFDDPDENTMQLERKGTDDPSSRAGGPDGTQALVHGGNWSYSQEDLNRTRGFEGDGNSYWQDDQAGMEGHGFDGDNYRQDDQAGMRPNRQNRDRNYGSGDPVEQNGFRRPQLDDLEEQNDTVAYGVQDNENRRQGDPAEQNDTVAYGAKENKNRWQGDPAEQDETMAYGVSGTLNGNQGADVYGNEEISRGETFAKKNAGTAGRCICRVCGTINDSSQNYCMGCGTPLKEMERTPFSSPKETDTVICPRCGMKNKKSDKYCFECGAPL